MPEPEPDLDLFLAYADEGRPVLEKPLPEEAAKRARRPKEGADDSFIRRRADADPNDLSLQKWSILAPEGDEGDRMLEALQPLRRLREREQGTPANVYRVPANMGEAEARGWRQDTFWPDGTPEEKVPLYVLMLGDLHQTSAELQHALATSSLVGRVHFSNSDGKTDLPGYAAYAEKVVRCAVEGTAEERPDLLFYTAPDGSPATVTGDLRLVQPSLAASREGLEEGRLPAASVRELSAASVDELLRAGAGARPSVLLSVSHGLGAPRRGWATEEDQRRRQGAMVIADGEILDAERARESDFFQGGMWFLLACFGAGTPRVSMYHSWLLQLSQDGSYTGQVAAVKKSLPSEGERPFIAALPQAVLASPRGPQAVIGHLDLAWTYSFSGTRQLAESRKSRILTPLEVLVRGSRVGVAVGRLMQSYGETNDDLAASYQRDEDARVAHRESSVDPTQRARLWMLRNDLRGYVLLGDPAARLPLQQNTLPRAPGERTPEVTGPAGWKPPAEVGNPWTPERAVLGAIRGDESMRVLAQRAGVSVDTLWGWVDDYRAAGRGVLPR